jgi:general secretion pathway protein G
MMVLAIIALLAAFLIPAIAGAYRQGKEAAEIADVGNLVAAVQKFKDRFGVYPPSQIILRENGAYNGTNTPVLITNGGRGAVFDEPLSIQYLRRIWPQLVINVNGLPVDYTNNGTASDIDRSGNTANDPNDFYDWNGDGIPNGPWFLEGDECLVFFLGGIPTGQYLDLTNNPLRPAVASDVRKYPPGVSGFSKTPHWPCQRVAGGAGLEGPFMEFVSGRLIDSDRDSFWELLPFRKPSPEGPYVYFSAYEGAGYRPDDLNLAQEPAPNLATVPVADFLVLWPLVAAYPGVQGSGTGVDPYFVRSLGPNPYTVGASHPGTPLPLGFSVRYHKPDSFQIISPGPSVGYGHGGEFPLDERVDNTDDKDNLTNFSPGALEEGKQ